MTIRADVAVLSIPVLLGDSLDVERGGSCVEEIPCLLKGGWFHAFSEMGIFAVPAGEHGFGTVRKTKSFRNPDFPAAVRADDYFSVSHAGSLFGDRVG